MVTIRYKLYQNARSLKTPKQFFLEFLKRRCDSDGVAPLATDDALGLQVVQHPDEAVPEALHVVEQQMLMVVAQSSG